MVDNKIYVLQATYGHGEETCSYISGKYTNKEEVYAICESYNKATNYIKKLVSDLENEHKFPLEYSNRNLLQTGSIPLTKGEEYLSALLSILETHPDPEYVKHCNTGVKYSVIETD